MLYRKMLREIKSNLGQFISIFILAFLAISLFACMKASNISAYNKRDVMYKDTNMTSGIVYGENFTKEDVDRIKTVKNIDDAQIRIHFTASAKKHDKAQVEVYAQDENIISKPMVLEGKDYNEKDTESVWITRGFAKEWKIKLGDKFSFIFNGVTITKKVAGLIAAPEYQYLKADKDLDIVVKNITVLYMAKDGLPEELKQIIPYTELVFKSDKEDVKTLEKDISKALDGNYAVVCDKDDLPGVKIMNDELAQHDQFAISFPVIFIMIALLVIMTSMNRMIDKQRTQIGTMRALGIKRKSIIIHYLSYSFVVSFFGCITGVFFGTYVLGELIAKIFREWYIIPNWTVEMDYTFAIICLIIVMSCVLATYFSCRKVMNIHPAESLRPKSPKSGKKIIFEKLPFWNKLGFNIQYNLRDMARGKLRSIMGVFGTAAGMMLMVSAFASYTTIKNTSSWTFDKLQNYNSEIDFDDELKLDDIEKIKEMYNGELMQTSAVEISSKKPKDKEVLKKSTVMFVTEGKGLYALTDVDQKVVKLEKGKIAITRKLADSLSLKVGDKLYWHLYKKNTWYDVTIGLINRNPNVAGVTMLREDYEKLGIEYEPNILYTKEKLKLKKVRKDIKEKIFNNKESDTYGIKSVFDDTDMRKSFDVMMEMINMMIGIFIIFACILPIVVLYNCGNLSFNERVKEFATLKVLGFSTKRIRRLISLQNLWLSIIGVIIGLPFGTKLLQYMFDSNGDAMDYQVGAGAVEYLISGIGVLIISVAVSYMFNKRIKKLDMVEILKGME
ncbi:ABC transporter permease [Eubacterium sp.]|uniref:ABC transporter permease n=1 Tax=Eubacterium sp. TaxID=142586 RepID=UPI0025DCB11D|nr:ABC transporter permease [Eubacterium sp.]MCR5629210.1 ABC transporter permease [Eubacterium sp.]